MFREWLLSFECLFIRDCILVLRFCTGRGDGGFFRFRFCVVRIREIRAMRLGCGGISGGCLCGRIKSAVRFGGTFDEFREILLFLWSVFIVMIATTLLMRLS